MALFIITTSKHFGKLTQQWHVGEPIPTSINERVVTFQADGDELDLFVDAMMASRGEANGICWEKGKSFRLVVPQTKSVKVYRIWYTPNFEDGMTGSAITASPTGIIRKTERAARLWIDANPAHDGTWEFREENA